MILVTMESSPLAITVNTESTMFKKENPLISLSIVKSSSVSLYTISSPIVNLKQNPPFFFFKISDRGFIFNHWKSDLYLQIPTSEKYIEKLQVTIDDNDNSNIIVEFKIEQKKKDLISKFEIQPRKIIFLQPCFTILLIEGPIVIVQGRAIVLPRGEKFEIGALRSSRGSIRGDDHR